MGFFADLIDLAVSIGFIFGPTSGYYFQYQLVRKTKSLGSFSTDVCAILIFSNLLRIFFWICRRFDEALLFQSFVMIAVQLLLLRECIKVKAITSPINKFNMAKRFKIDHFWRWDDFGSYLECSFLGCAFIAILTLLLSESYLYVEMIGFASVLVEACLGLPQLLANRKNKSTAGLSMGLILTWFSGDLFKTLFFILKAQPLQFVLCGLTQIIIDTWIIVQIFMYGKNNYHEETRNWFEVMPTRMTMHRLLSFTDEEIEMTSRKDSLIY